FNVIFHEYVHLLINDSVGSVPLWFNEGLAEYYSTFDISDDRKVMLGKVISNHVLLLREQRVLPLRTLFAVDRRSPYYNERQKQGIFYAESWAVVHYLIQGNNGQRLPKLNDFFNLIASHVPTEEAFKRAFGISYEDFEKELKKYLQNNVFQSTVVTFPNKLTFDTDMQSAPVSEAEAQAYLGDLLLHSNRTDAETYLQKALQLDPQLAMAHASLGLLRVRQGRFNEATQSLQRAVAANSPNYLAHYYYAEALSREGMSEGGLVSSYPPETLATMQAELKRAIELAPGFPGSYELLAFVQMVSGENLDDSISLLKHAIQLAPGRQGLALMLGEVYMHKQDYKSARQWLEPLANSASDEQLRGHALSLLNTIKTIEQASQQQSANDSESTGVAGAPALRHRGAGEQGTTPEQNQSPHGFENGVRQKRAGESQARGHLIRIDCSQQAVTFMFKLSDGRTLKLQSSSPNSLELITYTQEGHGEMTCGAINPPRLARVSYLAATGAHAQADGEVTAIEFIPADFPQ
ncbi:MAG TPA: tetratricopeptide repeat protein, partial [Pyrinomonadaceae bacterium]|nr:tetratricopeptide repeat protein [Pyrinomonadaceae bacterium]